jgi:hypothetical protein
MTQALYAHMNNKRKKIIKHIISLKKKKENVWVSTEPASPFRTLFTAGFFFHGTGV